MVESINTLKWQQLEPKVKTLWRVSNLILSIFLSLIGIIPDLIIRNEAAKKWPLFPFALPLILFVILGILTQILVSRTYHAYRYQLGENDLAVSKGVFWRTWRFVNRNRVQHVDVTSGPIARALGLYEVSIFVGGMPTAAVVIPGLSQSNAELLRSSLVKASDVPEGQGAVPPMTEGEEQGFLPPHE